MPRNLASLVAERHEFASPHVAGVAAAVIATSGAVTFAGARILQSSSDDLGAPAPIRSMESRVNALAPSAPFLIAGRAEEPAASAGFVFYGPTSSVRGRTRRSKITRPAVAPRISAPPPRRRPASRLNEPGQIGFSTGSIKGRADFERTDAGTPRKNRYGMPSWQTPRKPRHPVRGRRRRALRHHQRDRAGRQFPTPRRCDGRAPRRSQRTMT